MLNITHKYTYIANIQKVNILKFKIIEKSLASKDTLKNPNKYNYCTKYKSQRQPCTYSQIPHAHTPAQTQNTQSPPPHTDPPTMQVWW